MSTETETRLDERALLGRKVHLACPGLHIRACGSPVSKGICPPGTPVNCADCIEAVATRAVRCPRCHP